MGWGHTTATGQVGGRASFDQHFETTPVALGCCHVNRRFAHVVDAPHVCPCLQHHPYKLCPIVRCSRRSVKQRRAIGPREHGTYSMGTCWACGRHSLSLRSRDRRSSRSKRRNARLRPQLAQAALQTKGRINGSTVVHVWAATSRLSSSARARCRDEGWRHGCIRCHDRRRWRPRWEFTGCPGGSDNGVLTAMRLATQPLLWRACLCIFVGRMRGCAAQQQPQLAHVPPLHCRPHLAVHATAAQGVGITHGRGHRPMTRRGTATSPADLCFRRRPGRCESRRVPQCPRAPESGWSCSLRSAAAGNHTFVDPVSAHQTISSSQHEDSVEGRASYGPNRTAGGTQSPPKRI